MRIIRGHAHANPLPPCTCGACRGGAAARALELTPEQEGVLAEHLAASSPFDLHGAVGAMHAVASSPERIPFVTWRPVVHPPGFALTDDDTFELHELLFLGCRMVHVAIAQRQPLAPPPGDPRACASFARGYLAGLELWPASVSAVDKYRCAAWACALSARLDLLPREDRVKFRLTVAGRAQLRRSIGAFVLITHDLYAIARDPISSQNYECPNTA